MQKTLATFARSAPRRTVEGLHDGRGRWCSALVVAVCVAVALLRGEPALAQDGGPDPNSVRIRMGPLMMNPTISISNIGIDRNVFNDPPDKSPKQDFTATIVPAADFWLHLGPTWVTASLNESINWFQQYSSERTANNQYKLGWNVPGSVVAFKIDGTYIHARERPGFEIDTRAARKETLFGGSLDYHALSRSFVGVTASRQQTRFADNAEFLGINLRTSLNLVTTTVGLNVREQLTPLTGITFSVTRGQDRFEFSPGRNTESTSAFTSVAFGPGALIKGTFSLGYTDFRPIDSDLPGFRGMTGKVDLIYVLLGSTRFAIVGSRGVKYSYEANQPYYIQSVIGGSVAQQIFGPFDVQVRGDLASLGYRSRIGAVVAVPDRTDRVTTVGLGIGFHMGKDLRLSFNVDQNNRETQVLDHQYQRFLFGTALTYGF